MHLSIADINGDDAYKRALCRLAIVTLNGNKVDAVEADEEEGYVIAYVPRTDPRYEIAKAKVEGWPVEKLYGTVRIIDPLNVDQAK